ncbi:hypothetical protein BH23GEM3_BH23GEM3_01000 [soil metagenome]|nr:hypothetical protein [Gemmatimonadota bacterium]
MTKRNVDPEYDADEIRDEDPLGEQAFEETGFQDAPDGGPILEAPGLDTQPDKPTAKGGQKIAGVPEEEQNRANSSSRQRPDSEEMVIRERGGATKGDPAVGGTRPE